jgi:hypothetical protein
MIIQEQRVLADSILDKLKVISPYAILAGGAPRDWYLETQANDLDFYLYSSAITVNAALKQLAKTLDIDVERIKAKTEHANSLYATMRCLRCIFDVSGYNIPVQIMLLIEPRDEFRVVDLMSTSICKIYYEDGKLTPKRDFLLTMKSGVIFLDEGYKWSDPHPSKMAEKFRGIFPQATKEQAIQLIVNKALRG